MSITEQFWQYAKEATLSASYANRLGQARSIRACADLDASGTTERASSSHHDSPAEASAA